MLKQLFLMFYIHFTIYPKFFSQSNWFFFIIKYVTVRKMYHFCFKKKQNIQYENLGDKRFRVNCKLFFCYWFFYIFKDLVIFLIKKFAKNFYFWCIEIIYNRYMIVNMDKKKKNLDLTCIEIFFYNNNKFFNLKKQSSSLITNKNLKFLLFIGKFNLKQLKWVNLDSKRIFDNEKEDMGPFSFCTYKERLSQKKYLYTKIKSYRFWKKISFHPFFLCPVEKNPFSKNNIILPCGHIFSTGTINSLSMKVLTNEKYINKVKKAKTAKFIECPWCEVIHENLLYSGLVSDPCFFSIEDFLF